MVLHGKEEQKLNELVLQAVASMPTGGGYATIPTSFKNLHQALSLQKGSLVVRASSATPSFCSEATYLVFLKTIQTLQEQKKLFLEEGQLNALLPHHESDGHGFWGCWNANGPGVARLFYVWDLGPNFTDLSLAEPGDFLKIFWTDAIGSSEHGHSVIYLGIEQKGGITYLNCWSSNKPDGYGKRSYPLSRVHHLIFSRLKNPASIAHAIPLTRTDSFLASLLFHPTSWAEVKKLCAIRVNPGSSE